MTLTLYHARRTRSLRPLWLMEEMGLTFELETLKFKMGDTGGQSFAQINPLQKLPALKDGDLTMLESVAIMDYLMGRYGPSDLSLTADEAEYGQYLQWFHAGESYFGMYMSLLVGHRLLLPEDQRNAAIATWACDNLQTGTKLLGDHLQQPDSILKRGFSAADISVGYVLSVLEMVGVMDDIVPQKVTNYWDALKQRDAWKRAIKH